MFFMKLKMKIDIEWMQTLCWLMELTVQFTAQQLQSEAQALVGGSLRVDPDEAGQEGTHRPQLWGVVVLIPNEYLRRKTDRHVRAWLYFTLDFIHCFPDARKRQLKN